jgi:hypothetical protein
MAKLQRGVLKLKKAIDWNSFRPVLEEVTGYKREIIHPPFKFDIF